MAAPTGARKSCSCRGTEWCGVACEAASAPSPIAWRPVGPRCGVVRRGRKGRAGRGAGWRGGGDWGVAARSARVTGGRGGRRDPRPSPSRPQAAAYGRCVQASMAPGGRLRKDLCAQEFEALRSCFVAAVGGRRPRPGNGPWETVTHVLARALRLPFLLGAVLGASKCFRRGTPSISRRDPRRHGARVPVSVRLGEHRSQRVPASAL